MPELWEEGKLGFIAKIGEVSVNSYPNRFLQGLSPSPCETGLFIVQCFDAVGWATRRASGLALPGVTSPGVVPGKMGLKTK